MESSARHDASAESMRVSRLPRPEPSEPGSSRVTVAERAPGAPGAPSDWSSSRKSGVGTSRAAASHVWFAVHRGVVGEVFYPRVDLAAVKDLQLVVTDGQSFFSEEKADTEAQIAWLAEGVPGFTVVNTCKQGRYQIEKLILTDPLRSVLLQRTRFRALQGAARDYRVHVLCSPRLGNHGSGNSARVGDYKGRPVLFAEAKGFALALACSAPWRGRSVGYVGCSDAWQDLHAHYQLTWEYRSAPGGNVALAAELDLSESCELVLALGFARTANGAAHRAFASLALGFDAARELYQQEWERWQSSLRPLASGLKANTSAYRVSTSVLATHESKGFPGGIIASLSFPWGETHGDQSAGGYHLVWPRDAYETASALLAAGAIADVVRLLRFFEATQEADGHWPQNMWLDGTGHWTGIQLDETAAPVLLLDLARRHAGMSATELRSLWPMARSAAGFLVRTGPATPQDRWEEASGLTSHTLACCIAALLVAAELAESNEEHALADYLRDTADYWNDSIESWLYAGDTALARQVGVAGYYVRTAPRQRLAEPGPLREERLSIANLPASSGEFAASEIVCVDVLALVRLGPRAPNDPRIVDTVRVIDQILGVETPKGPCWRRYNHDGYGEHANGSAYDGCGIGRPWPLLVGERAHYELAAGNRQRALELLATLERFASSSGFIPEQIWDGPAIPARDLFPGKASNSARPLVWAHAEHIKLLRSLQDQAVFDLPPQTVQRYQIDRRRSTLACWRFDAARSALPCGRTLRLETLAGCTTRWTADDWRTWQELEARDTGLGLFFTDLPTAALPPATRIAFTFHWRDADRWEGRNFCVDIADRVEAAEAP
jgi:glucoamylase